MKALAEAIDTSHKSPAAAEVRPPTGRRVVILSGNHLCHNPRVLKEADALHEAGFVVTVLGGWLNEQLAERDLGLMRTRSWAFRPVVDMRRRGLGPRELFIRVRGRLARACYEQFGWSGVNQLGYAGPELLRASRELPAELYIAHSEQAMWVAEQLARQGRAVGVDLEDWFSQDLTPGARRGRPVEMLRRLERTLLTGAVHRTCTSQAMSAALAQAYDVPPPLPVRNVFPWSERDSLDGQRLDRRDSKKLSIHWFSQTVGPGRGLEDLFAALRQLPPQFEVHLRGHCMTGVENWLQANTSPETRDAIHLHPLVENDELLSRIAEHDVGFAGETPYCANKDLTASNKIFHYMLAGLAVAASDTRGQREVLDAVPAAGALYPPGDAAALAGILRSWLENPQRLAESKAAALQAARDRYCWERESLALVASVEAAIGAAHANPQ